MSEMCVCDYSEEMKEINEAIEMKIWLRESNAMY
jgi:hypothetical protein